MGVMANNAAQLNVGKVKFGHWKKAAWLKGVRSTAPVANATI